jgi:hypothetical protein
MRNGMKTLVWTMLVFCFLLVGLQQALWRGFLSLPVESLLDPQTFFSSLKKAEPGPGPGASGQDQETRGTLFDAIKEALMEGAPVLDISGFKGSGSAEDVFAVVEKVVHQNPEILYYEGVKYWSYGRLEFSYRKDRTTIRAHRRALLDKVETIVKREIKPGMSEYDQVLAVHDYIIRNTRYDLKNLQQGTLPPESASPYGVLVLGAGVCEGYAKAMKLIMDRLGIPCLYVTGQAGGEGHAWNMVALEGRYYHIDLTWNDPVLPDGSQVLRHDYFNVTDQEMAVSHTWDRRAFPACTSNRHNYYYQKGLVVHSYEEFYELLRLALKNKAKNLAFRVPDYNEREYDLPATIARILKENRGLSHKGYTYQLPENRKIGVISIHFN